MIPLSEAIAGLRRNQAAFRPALEREMRVAMESGAEIARGFVGTEQPGWADLSPVTIAEKARLGYEVPRPLFRTGEELRDSIHGTAEEVPGGVRGLIYSTSDKMQYSEFGTSREPARPVLMPAMIATEPVLEQALGELMLRTLIPGSRP